MTPEEQGAVLAALARVESQGAAVRAELANVKLTAEQACSYAREASNLARFAAAHAEAGARRMRRHGERIRELAPLADDGPEEITEQLYAEDVARAAASASLVARLDERVALLATERARRESDARFLSRENVKTRSKIVAAVATCVLVTVLSTTAVVRLVIGPVAPTQRKEMAK